MKRSYTLLLLAGVVALGPSTVRAQLSDSAPAINSMDAVEVVTPTVPGYVGLPGHMDLARDHKHPHLNRHGYCCEQPPGYVGCGSMRETCRFIFGSCRSFFGEACAPKPPKYPWLHGRARGDR
jgi:hypothetical protein